MNTIEKYRMEVDQVSENKKLVYLLKIPIDAIRLSNFFCELYLENQLIGILPITISTEGIAYDTQQSTFSKIDWKKICSLQSEQLTSAIIQETKRADLKIVPGSFRRIFIEDFENNLFASFECTYYEKGWHLKDERILHRD